MSDKTNQAAKLFGSGYNCCQAVVEPFCEDLNIDIKTAMKFATGFGGGCRNGQICGAVSGAIMVLSLNAYPDNADPTQAKTPVYEKVIQFTDKFKAAHNSIVCKELLGYDLTKPDDAKAIAEKDLHNNVCKKLVTSAVEILEEMLQ